MLVVYGQRRVGDTVADTSTLERLHFQVELVFNTFLKEEL